MDRPRGRGAAGRARAPDGRRLRSPFAPVAPAVGIAVVYGIAILVWVAVGDRLPGGRWLAVHLFTLGALSNVVVAFTQHFGGTVTRAGEERSVWQPVALNLGVVLVLLGIPTGVRWTTAVGAMTVTAVVFASYLRLRRMRRHAVGARFVWIARVYERAHGAFIHGATLGLLLGVGVLSGAWYVTGRVAHLHVNVLGWGGLTLLATLVFFGPTVVRTRIEDGADARAATALRHGATSLTLAVALLLASGFGGVPGTVLRLLAAVGLGVYAWAVTVVCLPVMRVAWHAKPSAARLPLIWLCLWFQAVAWCDAVLIAMGSFRLLDALGVAALAGVLAQAIATALTYVAPMVRGVATIDRHRIMARFERGAVARTAAYNVGVAAATAAAAGGPALAATGSRLAAAGWALIGLVVIAQIMIGLWPITPRRPLAP
jgi:nitrite reductase (NO-forming)